MSEFVPSDGYAADLMGDATDRAQLAGMTETQREGVLFERGEARRIAALKWESQLAFRQQQAEEEQNARLRSVVGGFSPGIAIPSSIPDDDQIEDAGGGDEPSTEEDLVVSCCVCCVPDEYTDPDDPVLICEGCEINVHQSCYGMAGRALPEGDWYCELCRAGLAAVLGVDRVTVAEDQSVSLPSGANRAYYGACSFRRAYRCPLYSYLWL
jgi:hypothetical protein